MAGVNGDHGDCGYHRELLANVGTPSPNASIGIVRHDVNEVSKVAWRLERPIPGRATPSYGLSVAQKGDGGIFGSYDRNDVVQSFGRGDLGGI